MWNSIFNPENGFFRAMGVLVDVVAFSLMWLVCAASIVLLGPGTAALYDAMARCLRKRSVGGYVRFFESAKANFKVGCPAGLAAAAVGYVLVRLHGALYAGAAAGSRTSFTLYISFWVLFLVVCGIMAYVFPVLSRFEFGLAGLLSTGVKLALAHPFTTLALGLLTGVCVLLCAILWWPGLFAPYLWARLACPLLERVFRPFMEEQGKSI